MSRFFKVTGIKGLKVSVMTAICWFLWTMTPLWGYETSGLSLRLLADQEHPDLQYVMGERVSILIVMTNEAGDPIATRRGFSENELHRALTVIDPSGARHFLGNDQDAHKMPIPIFLNGKPWGFAEELPANWVRSTRIEDLTELVPVMKATPGWYTIRGLEFFARYAVTGLDPDFGFMGLLGNENNWRGAVESNTLQIYVAPPAGGQLQVQIVDGTAEPDAPLGQVPVKVFRDADILSGYTMQTAWETVVPVLEGTTDFAGYAAWESASSCLTSDNYTVLAKYGGEIRDEPIASEEAGWAEGCNGSIEKIIPFVEKEEVDIAVSGGGNNLPENRRDRATFSVDVSRIKGVASGKLVYNYTRSRVRFLSTAITEVEVLPTNAEAIIRGVGRLNNVPGYIFEATVSDGAPDRFGIIIKSPDGTTRYSAPSTALSGGDLTITLQ